MFQSDVQHTGRHWSDWFRRLRAPKEPTEVLASYRRLKRSKVKIAFGLIGLMLFCFIYGFFFSVLVPNAFAFLMAPLAIVLLLVVWALPQSSWAPTRTLEWLFYAMFIALIVWPNYLAIALPGLPWITLIRLTSFPLVLILLACVSMSEEFRNRLKGALKALSAIPTLLTIFVVIQLISIAFSADLTNSVQKFVVAQTTWTAIFFAAAYLFLKPGQMTRWARILWAMAVFVSVIAVFEYRAGHVLWVGHIPSFLKINDESVQRALAGSMRAGTTRYRAEATFMTPLGLAEYIALTLPFVLHFSTGQFGGKTRICAVLSIPLLLYGCYLTDAKLGTIGCLIGTLVFIFIVSFRNWYRNRGDLIPAAVLFSYPAGLFVVAACILSFPRLKVMILGGSSHDASTDARITQYTVGMQKFLQWPFGYGIGMGGETLGFGRELSGMITIDTYYLSVLLEYGVIGFIVYYGMFAIAIYNGGLKSLFSKTLSEDKSFVLPITVSLITFIVIKSVFSQQDNHPVVFMMLGALVALFDRGRVRATAPKTAGGNRAALTWPA